MNRLALLRVAVWIENAAPRAYRFLKGVAALFLVCFLALLCLIAFTVYRGLHAHGINQVGYTFENANRGIRELNLAAENLRNTAGTLERNSQQQLNDSAAALDATKTAVTAFNSLLTNTDHSLNAPAGLLPTVASAVAAQSSGLSELEKQTAAAIATVQAETAGLDPVLKNSAEATANAAKLLADPDLEASIHQATLSATQLTFASTSFANVMASADRDMQRIEPVIKKTTTPASLAARIAGYAVDLVAKTGSILAGFVR